MIRRHFVTLTGVTWGNTSDDENTRSSLALVSLKMQSYKRRALITPGVCAGVIES